MVEFRSLRPEELEQWFDHCMYVFNGDAYSEEYRKYFMNHWNNDPWRDIESILVAVEDDKILSTVRIFHRKMYLKNHIVSMGGIGEVSTKSQSRGLGLSTKLLSLAIDRMKKLEINVSTLATSEDKLGYYGRLGWQSVPKVFKTIKISTSDNIHTVIRPIDYEKDIIEIKDIYEQYSKKLSGTIARDNEYYWGNWVKTEYKNCLVAEKDGKLVAYMDTQVRDMNIKVREFGAFTGFEGLFEEMLEAVIAAYSLREAEITCLTSIKAETAIERVIEEKGGMIRLITPFFLGNKKLETTDQLLELMNIGTYREPGNSDSFTFWYTDGF